MKKIINFLVDYNISFSYKEGSLNVLDNAYLVDRYGTQDSVFGSNIWKKFMY